MTDSHQHGFPRLTSKGQRSVDARKKELEEIKRYQDLITLVNNKASHQHWLQLERTDLVVDC